MDDLAEIQKLHDRCVEHLRIIRANCGNWIDLRHARANLDDIASQLRELEEQLVEAGFTHKD